MNKKIKEIINFAKLLKTQGKSNYEIAKYVHIELGKIIVYDNDYTISYNNFDIDKKFEGKI